VTIDLTEAPTNVRRRHRGERRRTRHDLAERDLLGARLAELNLIRGLLEDGSALVRSGWVQHAWFVRADENGRPRFITAHNLHDLADAPVTGVCLVGSVVQAAGGPSTAHTQLVQRTLDLIWHTLHRARNEPLRWASPPHIRAAHLHDLTTWNDAPGRTAAEVTTLLDAARRAAAAEMAVTRTAQPNGARRPAAS
jgi:hypothetical protein